MFFLVFQNVLILLCTCWIISVCKCKLLNNVNQLLCRQLHPYNIYTLFSWSISWLFSCWSSADCLFVWKLRVCPLMLIFTLSTCKLLPLLTNTGKLLVNAAPPVIAADRSRSGEEVQIETNSSQTDQWFSRLGWSGTVFQAAEVNCTSRLHAAEFAALMKHVHLSLFIK